MGRFLLFFLFFQCSSSLESIISMDHLDAFINLSPQNNTHSYHIISSLQLKSYEFQFDTRRGRRQLGVLGPELQSILPDGTYIIPEQIITSPIQQNHTSSPKKLLKPKQVRLKNYYVIDKETLFMHNIGATQEIQTQLHSVHEMIETMNQTFAVHTSELTQLQAYLTQEASAQLKEKTRQAELETQRIQLEIEKEKVQSEEAIKVAKVKGEIKSQLQKEFHRYQTEQFIELNRQQKSHIDYFIRLYEESQVRIQLKTKEIDYEIQKLQSETAAKKAQIEQTTAIEEKKLEIEGKIRQQRLNEDIEQRQMTARYEAEKEKILAMIQLIFTHIGNGFSMLLSNKERLLRFLMMILTIAVGIYGSKEGIRISGQMIEKYLGKPSLIRETSRKTGIKYFLLSLLNRAAEDMAQLSDVILVGRLEKKMYELAKSTRNSRKNGAPFRHLLLYGPPGTGKTMVAKRLAKCSGLEYAIMSGGDVGPLGTEAVTELHAIFQWAKSSPRGVLLFIDEAEAFLGSRSKTTMSESMRNALNALLYQTGEQSYKFMMVIATNRPEDLDSAITDRIDETLHFPLPKKEERLQLLHLYFNQFLRYAHNNGKKPAENQGFWRRRIWSPLQYVWRKLCGKVMLPIIIDNNITPKLFEKAAEMTDQMSGREIAKLMLYMQSIVYGKDERSIDKDLFQRVLEEKIDEHQRKKALQRFSS